LEILAKFAAHEAADAERNEMQSSAQRLRAEQDSAYLRSLAADAQKVKEREEADRVAREGEEALRRKEEELAKRNAERSKLLETIMARIPPEPTGIDAIKLSLQLLNGQRIIRKFNPTDPVSVLYDWAFSLAGADLEISGSDDLIIRTMLPPVNFENDTRSLVEAGIVTRMKLIVERK
jgi:hypothetical protein